MNRDRLIVDHLNVAYAIARLYFLPGHDPDDLVQIACEGLIDAAKRYQPDTGVPFSRFAVIVIRRRLITHIQHEQRDRRRAHHEAMGTPLIHTETGETIHPLELVADRDSDDHAEAVDEIRKLRRLWPTLSAAEQHGLRTVINGDPYGHDKRIDNAVQRAKRKFKEAA